MNTPTLPLLPEVQLGLQPADQPGLDLASAGVQRYIWHSAYGAMLIEVRAGVAYVNGARVATMAELRATAAPGHEGLFSRKPDVHARLRHGVAR